MLAVLTKIISDPPLLSNISWTGCLCLDDRRNNFRTSRQVNRTKSLNIVNRRPRPELSVESRCYFYYILGG
jgi:hypothetical protein